MAQIPYKNPISLPTNATFAGLNINPFNGNPSTLNAGDIWFNNDVFAYRDSTTTQTLANISGIQTFTNKTLTSPKIGTSILDTNGNSLFTLTATASAVNGITYANSATNNAPSFTASGADTNIGITFSTKGTGVFTFNGALSLNTPLSITSGGTGQNNKTSAFNALSPITTKGDLITFDGTNNVRLPVGSNGDYFLNPDSTQTTGLKWTDLSLRVPAILGAITKEPTGFITPADNSTATISFVDGTRTFSITPVGASFDFYVQGIKYTKSSAQSITIPATEGNYYFYFDNTGTLQVQNNYDLTLIKNYALVASIYWDNTNSIALYLADERHGSTMDGDTHYHLHNSFGALYVSGFDLNSFAIGTGTLDTDSQFGVDSGIFFDEDIQFSYTALTSPANIPIFYKSGATPVWRKKTANTFPLIESGVAGYTGVNGRIAYNQNNAGTWQLTEIGEGQYVNVHYYAINDTTQKIIGFLGDNTYLSITDARTGQTAEIQRLKSNLPFNEFVLIGSVIFTSSTAFSNSTKSAIVANDLGDNFTDWKTKAINTNLLLQNIGGLLSGEQIDQNPANFQTFINCDFLDSVSATAGAETFQSVVAGGGSAATLGLSGIFSVITFSTGNTAGGSSYIHSNGQWAFASNDNSVHTTYFDVILPVLSTATQRYTIRIGLSGTNFIADPTAGIYLRYSDNLNGGAVQFVSRSGGVETAINTTFTPTANTRFRVKIVIKNGNIIYCFINDVLQGNPIQTNIPTSTALRFGGGILKSIGNTARTLAMDWFKVYSVYNTVR